jgi:hypothetical protein
MNFASSVMSPSILAATVPQFVAYDSSHKSAATVSLPSCLFGLAWRSSSMQIIFFFALLSTLVLSIVLLGVVWVVFFIVFKRTASDSLTREVFFFRSQLGQYAFSLLLSKWFSALSGLITIKWIREGGVTTGVKITSSSEYFVTHLPSL